MPLAFKGLYRFDEFEVDPSKRAFLRNGAPVLISPKAFEVLLYLVANPGRVVSKEELLKAVWPDSFVEESNLAQHVSWLRKGLADKSNYVVTVPGRGYQFTAQVRTEVPAARSIAVIFDGRALPLDAPILPENSAADSDGSSGVELSSSDDATPFATENHRSWKIVAAVAALGAFAFLFGCGHGDDCQCVGVALHVAIQPLDQGPGVSPVGLDAFAQFIPVLRAHDDIVDAHLQERAMKSVAERAGLSNCAPARLV